MPEAASPGHRGTHAVERMVEYAPSTGGLALWMAHVDLDAATAGDAPPVSTDGRALRYAPGFERLPRALQAGWVARAVLHAAFGHPRRLAELRERSGDVDERLFGLCADAIVDSSLAELGWLALPADATRLETLLARVLDVRADAESALREWDVERLYRAIDDRAAAQARDARPSRDGGARDGRASGARDGVGLGRGTEGREGTGRSDGGADGTDSRRPPAGPHGGAGDAALAATAQGGGRCTDGPRATRARALARTGAPMVAAPFDRPTPEAQAGHAADWAARLDRAHAADGAFSMLRSLAAVRSASRTPWEQVLRVAVARALSRRPAPSASRPSRGWLANRGRTATGARMPWEPGTTTTSCVARLAVVVDVSGSVDPALLERFGRELDAIARRHEADIDLVVGDDRVRAEHRFPPGRGGLHALHALAAHGGGGTDFRPLLRAAAAHRPDLAVVLTDLDGPAGPAPRCPVLWAVPPQQRAARAPFGRLLVLAD